MLSDTKQVSPCKDFFPILGPSLGTFVTFFLLFSTASLSAFEINSGNVVQNGQTQRGKTWMIIQLKSGYCVCSDFVAISCFLNAPIAALPDEKGFQRYSPLIEIEK